MATDDSGSVTYIHFGRGINRVRRNEDTNEIEKETILNLIIPTDDEVTDAYLLDGVVAV